MRKKSPVFAFPGVFEPRPELHGDLLQAIVAGPLEQFAPHQQVLLSLWIGRVLPLPWFGPAFSEIAEGSIVRVSKCDH